MAPNKHSDRRAGDPPVTRERPTHSEDGVDLTLIRWMLSMTPAERLRTLQANIRSIARLRDGNPDA